MFGYTSVAKIVHYTVQIGCLFRFVLTYSITNQYWTYKQYIFINIEHINSSLPLHIQPRSQALPSCGGKTLAGAGHVTRGNLIAQRGSRQSIK